jgi:hypothetical protein
MSDEFEVKGPHEAVLEAGETDENTKFNGTLAVMTAVMATIGALLSYQANISLGEAIIYKNEASIKKTEASDQWNYYQAKSNKQNLAELASKLTAGADREASLQAMQRYETEKTSIKSQAEQIDQLAHQADQSSETSLHAHHRWATGTTALQIGISLAAIALLTRRKWLEYVSLLCATIGIGFGVVAWLGL